METHSFLRISYAPSEASFLAYSLYHLQGSLKAKTRNRRQLVLAVLVFAGIALVLGWKGGPSPALLTGFTLGLVFFAFFPALTRLMVRRSIRKALAGPAGPSLLAPITLTILEDELAATQGEDNWQIPGPDIQEAVGFSGFFLITPAEGPGLTIPLSAFSSPEHREAFEEGIYRLQQIPPSSDPDQ